MATIIINIPDNAVTDGIIDKVREAVTAFTEYNINLTEDDKRSVRSMAEGREGYVRLVGRIAKQHPDSLSRKDNPSELEKLLDYYDRLENTRISILSLQEQIQETQLAASTQIMALADRYVRVLQIERDHNSSLDLAMREVDAWNKKFANRPKDNGDGDAPGMQELDNNDPA